MTYEEAIKYLSGLPPYCEDCEFNLNECDGLGPDCKITEANRIAIEALEKQMPKKVENSNFVTICGVVREFMGKCPMCNNNISCGACFCSKCGQAIDWSDE